MIPTYELTGESFNISGRGTVLTARLTSNPIKEELLAKQLLGTLINGQMIIGIESCLIPDKELKTGDLINLLVQKEKKMSKGKFTVSWIMADEPLLKLKEPDETYDIAENVFKFIQENKLHQKEDFQVEVEINESQGENGTITSLKEVGGSPENSKEEKPNPKSEDLIVKELTVNGVSVEKKAVKFKEDKDNDTWYTLDNSINAQDFKDKYTRKTVEISVRETNEGNDIITAFTVKEETPSNENSKDNSKIREQKKTNVNMMQKSIEAQASINSANRVAQAMITPESKPDDVKKIIRKVAEFNFKLIQEFKNKE